MLETKVVSFSELTWTTIQRRLLLLSMTILVDKDASLIVTLKQMFK
jgi:hypothetical protein